MYSLLTSDDQIHSKQQDIVKKQTMESRPLSAMGRAIERLKVKKNIAAFKPYERTECNDVFTNKSLLTGHLESVHKEKKPCDCRICGKSFVSNQTLIEHISAVHEGKKLHVQSVRKYFFSYFRIFLFHYQILL